ncbi:MAG: nucleotidyltransferase family protein, partial [Pseudomonadota bacterium]
MKYTALIMAAQRPGEVNPLAARENVSHKCLMDMDGAPMILRVLRSLLDSERVGEILICIDDQTVLSALPEIAAELQTGRVKFVGAGDNLFESVKLALTPETRFPVLVTTADNALQTGDMVDHFCDGFEADGCDVGVSITPAETIWAKYPEGQRRPHKFRDGKYSNCNLFGLRSYNALGAAKAFEGGGQFGKNKQRVLQAFGVFNLLLYVSKMMTLKGTFERISKRFGLKVSPIYMPFAEAPIDVDN